MNFSESTIIQKVELHSMKHVKKSFYRILISIVRDGVKYNSFVVDSNEDFQVLFYCRRQFSEFNICWCLFISVLVIAPGKVLVTSSSFTADLNRDGDGQIGDIRSFGQLAIAIVGIPVMIPVSEEGGEPDAIKDVLRDDDDVEPAMIDEDSNNGLWRSIPVGGSVASSSEIQQYPSHFLTLDLEAMT
ncbi:hypothetical protein Ahy_A08g039682 [Arachis hypogaea]|uniref:Uncharacterized protein n=1 Tax=Arachis hypogaea TaxID=3818 RepID=A0A445BWZ5_ARAHY|nr:hypothetical protein Ahy_A08g039682 [Arachis hypogaea]